MDHQRKDRITEAIINVSRIHDSLKRDKYY